MGVKSRPDSWTWVANHARDYLQGPNRRCANLIGNISAAFARAVRRIGQCRFPLYVTPIAANDMFDSRHMVRLRRIAVNRWGWVPRPNLRQNGDPNMRVPGREVATYIERGRRRRQRATLSPTPAAQGPLTTADRSVVQVPSEDRISQKIRQGSPSLNPPFRFVDSTSESEQECRGVLATPDVRTLERPGDVLDDPPS